MAEEYWQLLRDPRWQRKRLEVMQRADFTCEQCFSEENTLNVHHTYYEKGKKPWEYPADSLKCLCENCHESWHEEFTKFKKLIGTLDEFDLERVAAYITASRMRLHTNEKIFVKAGDCFAIQGIADAFGLDEWVVAPLVSPEGYVSIADLQELSFQRMTALYGVR